MRDRDELDLLSDVFPLPRPVSMGDGFARCPKCSAKARLQAYRPRYRPGRLGRLLGRGPAPERLEWLCGWCLHNFATRTVDHG